MKTACKKMITQQVSEILRIEIEDGDLYPGTKIPTDTELAEMFGVQKQIVRTAIEVLVKEGLLKYISDKEVYVLGHKIERNMEKLEGFTQTMLDRNMKPSFRIVSKYLRMAGKISSAKTFAHECSNAFCSRNVSPSKLSAKDNC